MATTIDERRQKTNPRPAVAVDLATVDGAAPLNLTPPGTMKPDAPAAVPTQPAPQFTRTNAGPMLAQPPAVAAPPAQPQGAEVSRYGTPTALSPERTQQLANQSAAYVAGAQAQPRPASPVQQMVNAPMSAPVRSSINAAVANPQPTLGATIDTSPRLFDPRTGRPSAGADAANQQLERVKAMATPGAAAAQAATAPPAPAAPPQQGEYGRQMGNVGQFLVDGIKSLVSAPGYGLNKDSPAAPAAVAAPGANYGNEARRTPMAPVPTPAAGPVGARGTNEAQAKNPASDQGQVPGAKPPAPQSAEVAGPPNGYANTSVDGVYRKGNSFTDEAGTRATPRAGTVSAQNNAAAEALAGGMGANQQALARLQAGNRTGSQAAQQLAMPSIKTSANDWETRNNLRSLRVSANSLTNEPRWGGMGAKSPDVQAYLAAVETDNAGRQGKNPMAQEMLQQQGNLARTQIQDEGATERAGMQEQGANARAAMTEGIQRGELDLKQEQQGFVSRAAQRLEAAQAEYLNAKTPEDQAKAAKKLREIQGKEKPESWKGVALQGGTDAQGNKTESVLAAVNESTGEMRRFGGQAPQAEAPNATQRPVGTVSEVNGKRAVWDGKKWVAQ